MQERFTIYKGLQKPLVFKGMQGRFIYLTMGMVVGLFILGVITYLIFGGVPALVTVGIIAIIGGLYLANEQAKGLYPKKRDKKLIQIKKVI